MGVLQSVLFLYREVSTAGNVRSFAVVDTECKAVPQSVVSWGKWPLLGSTLDVHSLARKKKKKKMRKKLNGDLHGSREGRLGGFLSKAVLLEIGNNSQNSFLKCCFDLKSKLLCLQDCTAAGSCAHKCFVVFLKKTRLKKQQSSTSAFYLAYLLSKTLS